MIRADAEALRHLGAGMARRTWRRPDWRRTLRALIGALGPPHDRGERASYRLSGATDRPLDAIFTRSGRPPAKNETVSRPYDEIHEDAGKCDVGEKMSAGGHAQHAKCDAKRNCAPIREQTPLRRRHGGWRQCPECARRLAGNE